MNYIELINNFWRLNKEYSFTPNEKAVYFALLNKCNELGWKNPFNQSNGYLAMDSGMSESAMTKARNILKQKGLIEFRAGDGRRINTIYSLKGIAKNDLSGTLSNTKPSKSSEKGTTKGSVKNDLSATLSGDLCGDLSGDLSNENGTDNTKLESKLNETKEEEITTPTEKSDFEKKIESEKPSFVQVHTDAAKEIARNQVTPEKLTEELLNNETCKIAAKNAGIKKEDYQQVAIERFVSEKFGLKENLKWVNMSGALSHFMRWVKFLPQILRQEQQNGGSRSVQRGTKKTGRAIVEQPGTDDSRIETDENGFKWRISANGVKTYAG